MKVGWFTNRNGKATVRFKKMMAFMGMKVNILRVESHLFTEAMEVPEIIQK